MEAYSYRFSIVCTQIITHSKQEVNFRLWARPGWWTFRGERGHFIFGRTVLLRCWGLLAYTSALKHDHWGDGRKARRSIRHLFPTFYPLLLIEPSSSVPHDLLLQSFKNPQFIQRGVYFKTIIYLFKVYVDLCFTFFEINSKYLQIKLIRRELQKQSFYKQSKGFCFILKQLFVA